MDELKKCLYCGTEIETGRFCAEGLEDCEREYKFDNFYPDR